MTKLLLPYVPMPNEFMTLLRSNLSVVSVPSTIFTPLKKNQSLYLLLEQSFAEFDDGRGLEKTMMALGWPNFRDRVGSLYVYKTVFGNYPSKTNMELVEDIKSFETKFHEHSITASSRLFMLGLYIKLSNIHLQREKGEYYREIVIPPEVEKIFKFSAGRSEKVDWLILSVLHLYEALGEKTIMNALMSGKKFDDLYKTMPQADRQLMSQNLLAYGASIREQDVFLYEKV